MREDMARVLVDRPRRGMRRRMKRRKLHQGQVRRPEETLRREPMSRGRGTKWLNENLAPLERYLRSQVGRPWDKVYSEICEGLRPTSAVQQHVRDHLADFVVVKTWHEDGEIVGQLRWGSPVILTRSEYGPKFYVAPRTGLLLERRRVRRRRRELPDPSVRWDGPWRQLRRIDSVWYALRLSPIPIDPGERAWTRDRLLGRSLEDLLRTPRTDGPLSRAYGRDGVFAAEKRQLSKRELRRLRALPPDLKDIDR